MDYFKPTLLVISSPSGACISTYINSIIPAKFGDIISFDRNTTRTDFEELLIRENKEPAQLSMRATGMMEKVLEQSMYRAIQSKMQFVLETPLPHADYWENIGKSKNHVYLVRLNCLCLDKISDCEARV